MKIEPYISFDNAFKSTWLFMLVIFSDVKQILIFFQNL